MDNLDIEVKSLQLQKLKLEINSLEKEKNVPKLWNSLEVTKFIASLALPLVLIYITSVASAKLRDIDNNQKAMTQQTIIATENNKRIYDLRSSIYQEISIRLNEVYSYIYYVGRWKELSPQRILENKRFCDEHMYANQPLFSPEFFKTYIDFMNIAYNTYSGEGEDAKLQTDLNPHKKYYKGSLEWNDKWDDMFFIEEGTNEVEIRTGMNEKYNELLTLLSKELNTEEQKINNPFNDFKPN